MSDIRLEMSLDVQKALTAQGYFVEAEKKVDEAFGRTARKAREVTDTWTRGLKLIGAEQRTIIEGQRKWEMGATKLAQRERELAASAKEAARAKWDQHYAAQRATIAERENAASLAAAAKIMGGLPALTRDQADALRGVRRETTGANREAGGLVDNLAALSGVAGGVSLLTGKITQLQTALAAARQEAAGATEKSLSRDESRAKLLQVAEGATLAAEKADYARLSRTSERLASQFGLDRVEADELVYEARQSGFEGQLDQLAAARPVTGDLRRSLGIARSLKLNFDVDPQKAMNLAMTGAALSPLELSDTSEGFKRIGGVARQIGSTPEEAMTYLSVLTRKFGDTAMASDRLAYLMTRIEAEGFGGAGIRGGVEKILGLSPEEYTKVMGERVEMRQTIGYLRDPSTQADLARIGGEIEKASAASFSPNSPIERKKAIAAQDPALRANYDLRRARVRKEIAQDEIARREAVRQSAIESAEAEMIRRGVPGALRGFARGAVDAATQWFSDQGFGWEEQAGETFKGTAGFFGGGRGAAPPGGLQRVQRPAVPAGQDPQMEKQTNVLQDIKDLLRQSLQGRLSPMLQRAELGTSLPQ